MTLIFLAALLQEEGVFKDRAEFLPRNKFPATPGRLIMALTADMATIQPLGQYDGRYNKLQEAERHFSEACLSANGATCRWIHVPVDADPSFSLKVPVGAKGELHTYPKLRAANLELLKRWDLKERYALVEVEVSEGQGTPAGAEALVVTGMKVLDGSKDFPIRLAEVVSALERKYEAALADREKEIVAGLEKAHADVTANVRDEAIAKDTRRRGRALQLVYVTWMEETKRVSVRFLTRIEGGVLVGAEGGTGARFRMPSLAWGVELGLCYEVSPAGKVEKVLTLPAGPYKQER